MYAAVPTVAKSLADYTAIVGEGPIAELRSLAQPLRGARVLHLNSTAYGGGVAELLGSLVPLLADLGLEAEWQVIRGSDEFFGVTKIIHNSLQGRLHEWTPEMREVWLRYNGLNAELYEGSYDFVIVHDPQPAGILSFLRNERGLPQATKWLWRCHIDLTDAQVEVWDFLRPYVQGYDAAIFTRKDYVKEDLRGPEVFAMPPGIDPLSPKNVELPPDTPAEILQRYGVDPGRPLILQVSRFDPWKDPLGVIDVYRMVKAEVPALQLVLIASMAADDPEGWAYYERTARRAGEDYDIHLLSNLNGVGNLEVNAFQRAASVVVQKSLREGFGLVVTEALWKARPVVAGNVGGIPLQVLQGQTGYLIHTAEECAERVLRLLREPLVALALGRAGREHVREHFLITRYLRDYLRVFRRLRGIPAPG